MIKVGVKQKPYDMWQVGILLVASLLTNSLAGFTHEGISRLCRCLPAHESRQLQRLKESKKYGCTYVLKGSKQYDCANILKESKTYGRTNVLKESKIYRCTNVLKGSKLYGRANVKGK